MPYIKLPESNGYVLCFRAEGKITEEDYTEHLIPDFHAALLTSPNDKVRLLIDIRGVELKNYNIGALWEDTKFGISETSKMERLAIIGEKRWEEVFVSLSKPFFPNCQIEFFKEKVDEEKKIPSAPLQWIFAHTQLSPYNIIRLSAKDVDNNNNQNIEKAIPFISKTNWVVCLDHTEEAQYALQEALTMIKNPRREILHVISVYGKKNENEVNDIVAAAHKYVKDHYDSDNGDQLTVESHLISMPYSFKYPGAAIIEEAKKINADYILMGNRGRGTLKKFVLGSVSQYVVEHSTCPVILCKISHRHHNA